MPEQNIFQKSLDKAIKSCGITATWLAKKASTSESNLSKFRVGTRDVYTETLAKYFENLPIEGKKFFLEDLLGESVRPRERSLTERIEALDPNSSQDRALFVQVFRVMGTRLPDFLNDEQSKSSSNLRETTDEPKQLSLLKSH